MDTAIAALIISFAIAGGGTLALWWSHRRFVRKWGPPR